MMSEIMVESYIKLTSSVITDEELVKQAEKYHEEFKQLLREVKK
jgi:predicted ATP-grasp superfamily ATP-dependent carboligase